MSNSKGSCGVIGGVLKKVGSKLSCQHSSASLALSSTLSHEASEGPFTGIKDWDNFICSQNSLSLMPSIGTKCSMSTDNFLSTQTRKSLKVTNEDDAISSVHSTEEEQASEGLSTPRSLYPSLTPVWKEIDLSPEIVLSSHKVFTQAQSIVASYGFVLPTPGSAWDKSKYTDSLPSLPTFIPIFPPQPNTQQDSEVQPSHEMNWSSIYDTICDTLCDINITNTNNIEGLKFLMSLLRFISCFLSNWTNNSDLASFKGTNHIIDILQTIAHSEQLCNKSVPF